MEAFSLLQALGHRHPFRCFPSSAEGSTATSPLLLLPVSTPHGNGMECYFIPWRWLLNEFYLFKPFLFYLMCSCWTTSTGFLMVKSKAFLLHLEGNLTCTPVAQVPLDLLSLDRNISSVILCLMSFCLGSHVLSLLYTIGKFNILEGIAQR